MSSKTKQTVVINGRTYDAQTGLPLLHTKKRADFLKIAKSARKAKAHAKPVKVPAKVQVISDIAPNNSGVLAKKKASTARLVAPAKAIHAKTQKSSTLRREILKKPARAHHTSATKVHKAVQRSSRITRFAPSKKAETKPKQEVDTQLAAQAQVLQQAHAEHVQKEVAKHKKPAISSRAVKEHLLQKGLEAAASHEEVHQQPHKAAHMSKRARFTSVGLTCLALVLLGGYLTYINIPNLSIRVAAANAGIEATLPQYQPAGYRIHGAIAYSAGEVEVKYKQNGGNLAYTLIQKSTDWDSQATLDNYVQPDSNDEYQIHSVQGLTVYTYNHKAVWVNDGILHIIDGTAPLGAKQVRNIAASM